jgi:hypothetical protein
LDKIEQKGVQESKFAACTYNVTEGEERAVALLSWSKVHEDNLNDQSRGGCNCSIF